MIRFIRPTLPPPAEWLPFLEPAYEQRVFSNLGPVARRFEAALTERYGGSSRQAVVVSSGTAGLTVALLALRVSGTVVVPSFTFPATAQAVVQAGCQPVFCDVSRHTWELAPEALRAVLDEYTVSAVVHVRAFGFCRDLGPVAEIAAAYRIPVVVDAAAALGGRLSDSTLVGTQGDLEVFSMHATKVFGIGEGGVILCEPRHAAALRRAANFGIQDGDVCGRGLNAKLSEFHSAVGLAVLRHVDDFIAARHRVVTRYRDAFEAEPRVCIPADTGLAPFQTFPVLLDTAELADRAVEACREHGVEVRR